LPEDTVQDHKKMLQYIQETTAMLASMNPNKYVVVGHHAPSKASTHPRYQTEVIMNGAYSSRLDDFILNHPQIKLWTHGHTHEEFDYMIGTTRVVCNPRGYINYEDRADDFKLKYVEI
jgi:Icc-related predicted phosphoesterase